ncbi:MAG: efflux RND transporter permease subunit [Saprospiraceae bacterium]
MEVSSDDIDLLVETSERLINYINDQNIPGIEELQADVKIGKPELIVRIDREAARRYGISTYNIASAIRTSVFGKEASTFKEGEDEYPIMIRLSESSRNNITELMNQRITFRNPANGRIVQYPFPLWPAWSTLVLIPLSNARIWNGW